MNEWESTGQTAKLILLEKKKILTLLELAQQIYSHHAKNPQRAPNFSLSTYLAHVILTSQIHIKRNHKERGSGVGGGNSSFSEPSQPWTAFYPARFCWQTAPLSLVHLLQEALPSNSNQCWISPSPFSWRRKHRSKVLSASTSCWTDHTCLFISHLVKKKTNPELRTLAWRVRKVLEQHRVLWDSFDEEKSFDSSLTLFAIYSFILPF